MLQLFFVCVRGQLFDLPVYLGSGLLDLQFFIFQMTRDF